MPINPLIASKIDAQQIPDKIKTIMHEIISAEDSMDTLGERKQAVSTISKIMERYADDSDIAEFCGTE